MKGREGRDRIFLRVHGNVGWQWRQTGTWDVHHESGQMLDHVAQWGCGISILGDFSTQLGKSLSNFISLDLLWAGSGTRWLSEIPSNLNYSDSIMVIFFLSSQSCPRVLAYLTAPPAEATRYLAAHICVSSSFPFGDGVLCSCQYLSPEKMNLCFLRAWAGVGLFLAPALTVYDQFQWVHGSRK